MCWFRYDSEKAWLDRVEETINRLRKPEELRPEQYQQQLDLLVAEYAQLQERTEAIENVNREGGKFIREAKGYDGRLKQFTEGTLGIHGHGIRNEFKRTTPQPKNGAQIVTEELEALNRRFAQLSSLILERRNIMNVLIQNWKRQKQDSALREAMNRQAEIGNLIADLSRFEDTIYTHHLSFDLSAPDSADRASKGIQNLKENVDSWADRVREKLRLVDSLCSEGADTLPPEQYAALKDAKARLERSYDDTLRTIENVQDALRVIARLLIDFNNGSSEMHSWITEKTRQIGDIRGVSADPIRLEEGRRLARNLEQEIAGRDATLKELGKLYMQIDTEISSMYASAPAVAERSIHSGDVQRTLHRLDDDYHNLKLHSGDLAQYQHRLAALGQEFDEAVRRTNEWLDDVEEALHQRNDGDTVEDRLQNAQALKSKVAAEQRYLDDTEYASKKLLNELEGTPAYPAVRQRHDAQLKGNRDRHNFVLDRMQQKVNDTLAEKAAGEDLRDSVLQLAQWADMFHDKMKQPRAIPLRPEAIERLKEEEQAMRSDLEARRALVDTLSEQLKRISHTSAATKGVNLEEKLEGARKSLQRSNSALQGYHDNLADAHSGVLAVHGEADSMLRSADQLNANLKGTAARDEGRLAEAQRELQSIMEQLDHAKEVANRVFSIPEVVETDAVRGALDSVVNRLNSIQKNLDDKRKALSDFGELEQQFEQKRAKASEMLSSLEDRVDHLPSVAVDVDSLRKQRQECLVLVGEHSTVHPSIEQLEELAAKLAESTEGSSRTPSWPRRQASELANRFNSLGSTLKARNDKINENEQKASDFSVKADDLLRWIAKENKAISDFPIPLSREEADAATQKLHRFDKEIRGEQRHFDDVMERGRLLRADSMDEAAREKVTEKLDQVDAGWSGLQDTMNDTRDRIRAAESLSDKNGLLMKWLGTQQRHLATIGTPSTDPLMARNQTAQLQLIKSEVESEKPLWTKLNDLAQDLVKKAPEGSNYEAVVKMTNDMNDKWMELENDLKEREEGIKEAARAGEGIHSSLKEAKKELGQIEEELARVARMGSDEEHEKMKALDSLDGRSDGVSTLVGRLDDQLAAASRMNIDPVNLADLGDVIDGVKTRSDEVTKKIAGVRAAALSARDKEIELGKQLDALLGDVQKSRSSLDSSLDIVADPAKVSDQLEESDQLYNDLLAKDGEIALIKAKAKDQMLAKPDAQLQKKVKELGDAWSPLLSSAKDRKDKLDKVAGLLKKFVDLQATNEQGIAEDAKAIAELSEKDEEGAKEALKAIESSLDKRGANAESLEKWSSRIEQLAPGADARKLKRQAENALNDIRELAKKARSAASEVQRKGDLAAKFARCIGDAKEFAEREKEDIASHSDQMTRDRARAKANEVESYWNRAQREMSACASELEQLNPDDTSIQAKKAEVSALFADLLDELSSMEANLGARSELAESLRDRASSAGSSAHRLCEEIGDSDSIGRCAAELEKNLEECAEQEKLVNEKDDEIEQLLDELNREHENDVLTPVQFEMAKAAVDDARGALKSARRKLALRRRKISQTADELEKIAKESGEVCSALSSLADSPVFSSISADPQQQAKDLRVIRDKLRPLTERAANVVGDCQALIKSAPPETNTKELDGIIKSVNDAQKGVADLVEERERAVDAAAQEMGKYEDAHRALWNWMEETEEHMENLQAPSSDAKVARAQRNAYDILIKHIEDKQPSVDGFVALIDKMKASSPSEEDKAGLQLKSDNISNRYSDLLARALDGQARRRDAAELAERFTTLAAPFESWLAATEKKLNALGQVSIDLDKIEDQVADQLEEEIEDKKEVLDRLIKTGQELAELVSVEDANALTGQIAVDTRGYESVASRARACKDALGAVAEHLKDFMHDLNEMETWLTTTEDHMVTINDIAVAPDDLAEKSDLLVELAGSVTERQDMLSALMADGKELCRQTSKEDAVTLATKLASIGARYSDLSYLTDEKLALMEKALPLSERYHEGYIAVMEWIEAVEDDLRIVDEVPIDTQLQIMTNIEEDFGRWQEDIEDVANISRQLQSICGEGSVQAIQAQTSDMNRRANAIGTQVTRRLERLLFAEKQSRGVIDELDFVCEWLEEVEQRVSTAPPPSIIGEACKNQLNNQHLLNQEVGAQRTRLRDATAEARKIARQVGADGGQDAALLSKSEAAKGLADQVQAVCDRRAELLENGLALSKQLESGYENIAGWLDSIEAEIQNAPSVMTGTPPTALAAQQKHNMQLAASISAQQPLIERFEKNITAFQAICHPEDGIALEELKETIASRVEEISENVRARGDALDSVMDMSSAFNERLDVFLSALANDANKLRINEPMSSDVTVLEGRAAENRALVDGLHQKEVAMDILLERAKDILARAKPGDAGAKEVAGKVEDMKQLWDEISTGAVERDRDLLDALDKARRFWKELTLCQRALDDLKRRLDHVEPAAGQPHKIQQQQNDLDSIGADMQEMQPMLAELHSAGKELSAIVPPDEQSTLQGHMDAVTNGFGTITELFAGRIRDLGKAMDEAMSFHSALNDLLNYLLSAEETYVALPPLEIVSPSSVAPQLELIRELRQDIDEHAVQKEQLQMQANAIAEGAPVNHVSAIRQPLIELNNRWSRLYNQLAEREQALGRALLEMGKLIETAQQLIAWMDKTEHTLGEFLTSGPANIRQIDIQLCKLAVIRNDVQAHEPSILALNDAAQRADDAGGKTGEIIDTMNDKWNGLNRLLDRIAENLGKAKGEAESVGGEMERWIGWADDMAAQLGTNKPIAGIPETAHQQINDFLVLHAEVEQNRSAIEGYLRMTDQYLNDHPDGQQSWIGKNHQQLANKWAKIKDLVEIRETKLRVALEKAVHLEEEMGDIRKWLDEVEEELAKAEPVGRVPHTLDQQWAQAEQLEHDINARKEQFTRIEAQSNQMQIVCEKKDTIYIKNQVVTTRTRLNRFYARANDRKKQVESAQNDCRVWLDGVEDLEEWMADIGRRLATSPPTTSDLDRLKHSEAEAKALRAEVGEKRPHYETVRRRGITLAEHAPKSDRKEIEARCGEVDHKWSELDRLSSSRVSSAEKAVLEGDKFTEAIASLDTWMDGELADRGGAVRGDIDTVTDLARKEQAREKQRKEKRDSILAVTKKARDMVAEGVEERENVEEAAERLEKKWNEVEENADDRRRRLEAAIDEAASYDSKVHALLDWLEHTEKQLKPTPSMDLPSALAKASEVRDSLRRELPRLDSIREATEDLLANCHPMAEPAVADWKRVIEARWKEVEDRAEARENALEEENRQNKQREALVNELTAFVDQKRQLLDRMIAEPPIDSVDSAEGRIRQYDQFDFDLREKQHEVDAVTKAKRKDGQRDKLADELGDKWKKLWSDSLGYFADLEAQKAYHEELKRLEGWKFDDWKDRYVEWNDHAKARVNDLFRKLDRSATGMVPRNAFIDAIINSRFPTSRLEMAKVADVFDKDGKVNSKEFINALRFDKSKRNLAPRTEEEQKEMIREEMKRQRDICTCCTKYEIEKIGENHYKFGDTEIKRMVRILRSTVMVRVGGGWEPLDEFLEKHDPCRAKNRTNTSLYKKQFYDDVRPANATDNMYTFTKNRHAKTDYPSPTSSGHQTPSRKESVTLLAPFQSPGTLGPATKIREKTNLRSVPMHGENRFEYQRAPSDMSLKDYSRPSSRASEASDTVTPTRIPSLRKKGQKGYNPPSTRK